MNQILVTKKLYVTPELKKKKKIYQLSFILSIIMIIALTSIYIYAEYDKTKGEEISKYILESVMLEESGENINEDTTTISDSENALIVAIEKSQIVEENISTNNTLEETDKNAIYSGKYTAPNGKSYSIIGMINVPKLNIKYPIMSETTDALMKISVCKFWGPDANEIGNLCIIGHNYKNSKFFSNLTKAACGDTIEITDLNGETVTYQVYDIYTVDPSDTKCTSQLTQGKREVTLITCTNDTKQRIVIKCTEKI